MRKKSGSFLKRIASGGVLAAGVAFLFATGCVALDEEELDENGEVLDYAEDGITDDMLHEEGMGHEPTNAEGEGNLTAICHFGPTFSQEDSVDMLVSESELPIHLGHGDALGTCADFFCGLS